VGIICETPSQLVAWRKLPADYVIVHESLVTQKLIQLVHSAGRKIFVWTVNDQSSMLRLADWGVDAILSDKPQLLGKTLGRTLPTDTGVV
jgi:glycerophosphoryl diester phosphodiesterase